jgi:hypothetical protein
MSGLQFLAVGEFTKFVASDRVGYVPFDSKPVLIDVGLLYRTGQVEEKVKRLVAISSDIKSKL